MARPSPTVALRELERLAGDPEAQARYATLLATERRAQLVGPALAALEQLPIAEARPALLRLYADLDADGTRHDAGESFRSQVLQDVLHRLQHAFDGFFRRLLEAETLLVRLAGVAPEADLAPV